MVKSSKKPKMTVAPTETRSTAPASDETDLACVVGIGASAGGLEAIDELLASLPDDKVRHVYTITDNGCGTSKDFQRRMFEPYGQENAVKRTERRGTGLGQFIAKKMADAMGGTIKCESARMMLERIGMTCEFAENSQAAVQMVDEPLDMESSYTTLYRWIIQQDNPTAKG